MFPPDADESPYQAPSSSAGSVTADPKIINHANTRLPEQSEGLDGSHKTDAPPSPTGSRIAAAISGTPCKCNEQYNSELKTREKTTPKLTSVVHCSFVAARRGRDRCVSVGLAKDRRLRIRRRDTVPVPITAGAAGG